MIPIEEPAVAIARAFHDEYEAFAEATGWETQQRSRVAFDDLPSENRATMVSTIRALLDRGLIRPAGSTIFEWGTRSADGDQPRLSRAAAISAADAGGLELLRRWHGGDWQVIPRDDLVQRIRHLAHIASAPGMAEAMEDPVINQTVREIDSGTAYMGIEDEIHAIADEVEKQHLGEFEQDLDQLRSELQRIAEGEWDLSATDLLTWAEGWLLTLAAR